MISLSSVVSGLAIGSMYGLIALGFHVTWTVSRTVNFAQGTTMMVGAVLYYIIAVRWALPVPLAVVGALLLCALYGLLIERIAVRPFRERGSDSWLMATVAAGLLVDNIALFVFGMEPRGVRHSALDHTFTIGGTRVELLQLAILLTGLGMALLFWIVTRRTRLGKAMLAVVQNARASALMGINVTRIIVAAYAVSAVMAGIAGILIAPLYTVSASMGFLFGIKAFAVAILGGMDNPWGIVLAGLLFGLTEVVVASLLGSSFTFIVSFGLVILALYIMPHGLFGRAEVHKV